MGKTISGNENCFDNIGVRACGKRKNRAISLQWLDVSIFSCAGMLTVFFLAFSLLSVGNVWAGERELFRKKFLVSETTNTEDSNNIHTVYQGGPFTNAIFTYDGATYRVEFVESGDRGVKLRTNPSFPSTLQGANRRDFDLHLGTEDASGDYTENASFNFNRWSQLSTVPSSASYDTLWSGSAGWTQSGENGVIRITGPILNNDLQFSPYLPLPTKNSDGVAISGRLEIFDATQDTDGQWKWICDDGFGDDEAKVACGQLGLPASGATTMDLPDDWLAIPDNLTGFKALLTAAAITYYSSVPALLDDVDCDGTESRLINCNHAGRGATDCDISESVAVICQEEASE